MKKFFGIIGNPIKHSLSPILHNYWFKKYNIDANYSIFDVEEKDLPNLIKKIKDKSISGINITLPYKQKIIPYLDKMVNDAKATSSVNTVYLDNNKTVIGENTDVFGLQAAYLKEVDNALLSYPPAKAPFATVTAVAIPSAVDNFFIFFPVFFVCLVK